MRERLKIILSEIPPCDTFADIGCDHGYISKAMIDGGKCRYAIASDISAACLQKAQKTLSEHIKSGKAGAVVSDGFDNLPKADCALIAGMGGEETVAILKKCKLLPETLVLQPMKNLLAVRETVVALGYRIEKDFVFFTAGKYYDLIVAVKGEDTLSADEKEFGRTNILLRGKAFTSRIADRIKTIDGVLSAGKISGENADKLKEERERLIKYV